MIYCVTAFLLLIAGTIAASELYVYHSSKNRLYDSATKVPAQYDVALVLGCAPHMASGRINHYFLYRLQAAAELWKTGKIRVLIVSGDNSLKNYNEPQAMKDALIELGVPADRIICDYAGLRTLDSVVRAREIFHADRIVIVSQEYHNARALALSSHYDIDAVALNARNIVGPARRANWLRERAARINMLLDLWLLDKQPKYLGDPVVLPE